MAQPLETNFPAFPGSIGSPTLLAGMSSRASSPLASSRKAWARSAGSMELCASFSPSSV